MIARSFRTASELGILDKDHEALLKVLGALERGEIQKELFDMGHIGQPECGSPGCLIGWARTLTRDEGVMYALEASLDRLCYPYHHEKAFRATREQSAAALLNYLTNGEPDWEEIITD